MAENLKKIDFEELKKALEEDKILLLDVRKPSELKELGKIPGSKNVPVDDVGEAFALSEDEFAAKYGFPKPQKSEKIAIHCMKGGRASRAAETLIQLGCNDVSVYQGSFNDWKEKKGEIEKVE